MWSLCPKLVGDLSNELSQPLINITPGKPCVEFVLKKNGLLLGLYCFYVLALASHNSLEMPNSVEEVSYTLNIPQGQQIQQLGIREQEQSGQWSALAQHQGGQWLVHWLQGWQQRLQGRERVHACSW